MPRRFFIRQGRGPARGEGQTFRSELLNEVHFPLEARGGLAIEVSRKREYDAGVAQW